MRTYLDHNASAPLCAAAREAMLAVLERTGNASSVHGDGRALRAAIEGARGTVAGVLGVEPAAVVFTSGATEAAAHALSPTLSIAGRQEPISRLYVSAVEHPCVLAGGRFASDRIETVAVTEGGVIDSEALDAALSAHDRDAGLAMVAVMAANNETGVIQPIEEVARITSAHDAILVVDAVQALGRIAHEAIIDGADMVIASSHKIGGPQGAGVLVLARDSLRPQPLMRGGGQENFHRAGTENVAAIAGFAAATSLFARNLDRMSLVCNLRDSIEAGLVTISREAGSAAPVIFGAGGERLANTTCFAVPGIAAETALISLDLDGVSVSSGSACSSGKVHASHVLAAMGVDEELAGCAIRVSLGPESGEECAGHFLDAWRRLVQRLDQSTRAVGT